ncbi:helix-turn-helix transcriptional regulator [Halobacillus litoralis]|uniref:helix-turn-helix domain-containing protein n=1 Tax=Halobacillus litoralis TaxID=45668 RepID=UPI001CFE9D50|nr:helix-turn-helix transcriptional regulator [Halobacillus litoralis]WLR46560.1 helix-turn-helix transcriptional regulator [Halobacillus litoralis]
MEKALSTEFGTNVSRIRKDCGFTQQKLAEKANIDRSYLLKIEIGEANPSLSVILRLADSLKTTPYKLLETD